MKLGKLLYLIAIVVMAIMSYVMITHGWPFAGYFVGLITFAGTINYIDIVETNRQYACKKYKSMRAIHFNSMTHEQQERHLFDIHKEIEKKLKK